MNIQEIKSKLALTQSMEPWIEELEQDQRAGVQKLLASWKKKQEQLLEVKRQHEEKVCFDRSFTKSPLDLVAGVDEAGRGPLAGPVVTAAVVLGENTDALMGLNDSKQISKEKREELAKIIKDTALSYSIHFQSVENIDRLNIYEATRLSMMEAVNALEARPQVVLVDAMKLPIDIETHSIIKGDAQSLAIAAASILAKTARDAYMEKLHEEYPQYLFHQHAGYGTKEHVNKIMEYGPSIHHRKTFEPIKSLLQKSEVNV